MTAVKEYASAIFALGEEEALTELVSADMAAAAEVFKANADYIKLLDTPALAVSEKLSLIDRAFSTLCEYVQNLIKMLCEKHCVRDFCAIAREYGALYDESRGIERVEAVTAIAMSERQLTALKVRLEELTGKSIIIKNTVDGSILGGVKLRYMGRQLDSSIKTRLDRLEDSLKKVII